MLANRNLPHLMQCQVRVMADKTLIKGEFKITLIHYNHYVMRCIWIDYLDGQL